MRCAALGLVVAILLGGAVAEAQVCYPPAAHSVSYVCHQGDCVNSGDQVGSPAVSSRSNAYVYSTSSLSYNFGADAALAMDFAEFDLSLYSGGSSDVYFFESNGVGSSVSGTLFDCITIDGYAGGGILHIPFHVTGQRMMSWSAGGTFVPAQPLAGASFGINCGPVPVGVPTPLPCDDPGFAYSDDGPIDELIDLSFPFAFGQQISLSLGPGASTGVGYSGMGEPGIMQGMAALDLHGVMLAAWVTDPAYNVLPNVTITATSGFDYLNAPEPRSAAGLAAALLVLEALRRRRRR